MASISTVSFGSTFGVEMKATIFFPPGPAFFHTVLLSGMDCIGGQFHSPGSVRESLL